MRFKDKFNEIGLKYKDAGIEKIYKDYNLLCLLEILSEEFNDNEINDRIINLIDKLKEKLENQEVKNGSV